MSAIISARPAPSFAFVTGNDNILKELQISLSEENSLLCVWIRHSYFNVFKLNGIVSSIHDFTLKWKLTFSMYVLELQHWSIMIPVLYPRSSMNQHQISIMESNHHLTESTFSVNFFFLLKPGLSTFLVFISISDCSIISNPWEDDLTQIFH